MQRRREDLLQDPEGMAPLGTYGTFLAEYRKLGRLVSGKASHRELLEAAIKRGMVPLRVDAWRKIVAGVTTVSEVLRSVYIL